MNDFILEKKGDNNLIVTKYGSHLSDIKPKVIFLRSKAKITPTKEKETFEEGIEIVKNDFTKYVNEVVKNNTNLNNSYLFNIDISSKSVKYGKVSFLRYDVYLKPKMPNTIIKNKTFFTKIAERLDKRLLKLLSKHDIQCV